MTIHRREIWFLRVTAVLSLAIGFLITLVLIKTFLPSPPVELLRGQLRVERVNDLLWLHEERTYKVFRKVTLESDRTLVSVEDVRKNLPDGTVHLDVGIISLPRSFVLPRDTKGKWCDQMTVSWIHSLSLRKHQMRLPDICIEVE